MKILLITWVLLIIISAAFAQGNDHDAELRNRGGLTVYPDKAQRRHITFSAYPNPATETVSIQSDRPLKGFQVELLDKQGISRIRPTKFTGQSLDLTGFENGIYIIRLTRRREVYSHKIVIQRTNL